jgi:hypothetical protein
MRGSIQGIGKGGFIHSFVRGGEETLILVL